MDEGVETDEVIDYKHLDILFLNLCPELVDTDQILAKYNSSNPKFSFSLNPRLSENEFALNWLEPDLLLIGLREIVKIIGWEIVAEVGFEDEWRVAGCLFCADYPAN